MTVETTSSSEPDAIRAFVNRALAEAAAGTSAQVAVFDAVRAFSYATNAGSDASTLLERRAGNCAAKADLLARALRLTGCEVRVVRWRYRIEDPFADLLPVDFDVHTAVQVRGNNGWLDLDATHDSRLPSPPFVVNDWDGRSDTRAAYEPISPVWVVGEDDDAIDRAVADVMLALEGKDTTECWQRFNTWLVEMRRSSTSSAFSF